MVMLVGEGRSQVVESSREMIRFGSPGTALRDIWYVIDKGVPHEFFPRKTDMVVVSFHPCAADELEEITCGTREKRLYGNSTSS